MGRLYRPESKPEKASESDTLGTPEGRFYRPSSGVTTEDGEKLPARSADKPTWVAFAKSKGAPDAVESLTRAEIIKQYGTPSESDPAEPPADPAAETTQPDDPTEAAKKISVATGALEPPPDASEVVTDPAAETQQEEPVEAAQEAAGPPGANQPSGNASRGEWALFAKSQGATDEDLEGLGRNEIRAKYQSDLI